MNLGRGKWRQRHRRAGLTGGLVALAALLTGVAGASASPAVQLYVSPQGNDSWPGTKRQPFATLHRAQQAVRARTPQMSSDVMVNLRAGKYFLDRPLALSSSAGDSGTGGHRVIWQAHRFGTPARERVVVSGGRPIGDWQLADAQAGVWAADVGDLDTRQIYVDGRRAVRAALGAGLPGTVTETATGYRTDSTAPQSWADPEDIEVLYRGGFGMKGWPWTEPRCGVADITGDATGSTIVMDQPCFERARRLYSIPLTGGPPGIPTPAGVENARQFLTEPGEFYLDKSAPGQHVLYYIPRAGETLGGPPAGRSQVIAAKLETLVAGAGTVAAPLRDITFRGLSFSHATWLTPSDPSGFPHIFGNMRYIGDETDPFEILVNSNFETTPGNVYFRHAEGIVLRSNRFTRLGGLALEISQSSSFNSVKRNVFRDVSEGAIAIGILPPTESGLNRHNLISNNLIRDIGVEYRGAPGMWVSLTQDTTVSHNQVSDVPHSGIVSNLDAIFGIGQRQRILDNRIFRTVQQLDDGGGLYMVGEHGSSFESGAVVRGNFISDGPDHGDNVIGLYTDDTMDWATLEENVVYGYGRAAGGCVWPDSGVRNLRYVDNFWDQDAPTWLCGGTPENVTQTGHTTLDPADPAQACQSIAACAEITERAGLTRVPG